MKNKILICGRFLTATAVIVLCVLAFFRQTYPIKIFDMKFTAALQNGPLSGFGFGLIALAAVIGITLLFGHVYCSTLCTLGLYQEIWWETVTPQIFSWLRSS